MLVFKNRGKPRVFFLNSTHLWELLLLLLFLCFIFCFLNSGDLSRIPEILTNSVIDGAGVDSDIAEDDDEMSSPVKKAKHWRNPSY